MYSILHNIITCSSSLKCCPDIPPGYLSEAVFASSSSHIQWALHSIVDCGHVRYILLELCLCDLDMACDFQPLLWSQATLKINYNRLVTAEITKSHKPKAQTQSLRLVALQITEFLNDVSIVEDLADSNKKTSCNTIYCKCSHYSVQVHRISLLAWRLLNNDDEGTNLQ